MPVVEKITGKEKILTLNTSQCRHCCNILQISAGDKAEMVERIGNELISLHDDPHETLLASIENDIRNLMQL